MRLPKRFAGLHAHTCFSVFDGIGYPADHIDFVLENGMNAWAITDHGNANGHAHARKHFEKLQREGRKFRQLYGVEFYFVPSLSQWRIDYENHKSMIKSKMSRIEIEKDDSDQGHVVEDADDTRKLNIARPEWQQRYHLIVIARNRTGLGNLYTMVKKSFKYGFYRYPRIDFNWLKEHGEGLLVLTACLGGIYSYKILRGVSEGKSDNQIQSELADLTDRFVDAVGQDNFFLELQFNHYDTQHTVNSYLINHSQQSGIPLVVTADSHYYRPELWEARELYRRLGWQSKGKNLTLPTREDLMCELYPKNAEQVWAEFQWAQKSYPELYAGHDELIRDAIERTYDLAWERCNDTWIDTSVKLPDLSGPSKTSFQQLLTRVRSGMEELGLDKKPEYVDRIKKELEDIKFLGFENYFLVMHDVFHQAKKRTLFGCGRGSAAGGLINYVLGITQVDPIKYGLLWDRFLGRHRCLAGNVQVQTDQGVKRLDEITVGDRVRTHTGKFRRVTEVVRVFHDIAYRIHVNGDEIVCAPNHRWIVERDGEQVEIMTCELQPGDRLVISRLDEGVVTVSKSMRLATAEIDRIEIIDAPEDMYDITIEGDHTYWCSSLGEDWYLTHNTSWPDIDSDAGDRDVLIDSARELYGEDAVIPVSNFNTLKLLSLIKDISKFYGISFQEVNRLTSTLKQEVEPFDRDPNEEKSVYVLTHEACMRYSEKYRDFMVKYPQVRAHIETLFMQNRSIGRHAGGVIIAPPEQLEISMPIIKVRGELQTPWTEGMNFRNLEDNGFIKFDFLGLTLMKDVENCIRRILQAKGNPNPSFDEIREFFDNHLNCRYVEPNDPKVFETAFHQKHFAPGIFQFTQPGARSFCREVKPRSVSELGAVTAIYRPGPLKANVHKHYVQTKRKVESGERIRYPHPIVEEVLSETLGFQVFQEHWMILAQRLAGFTPGESDKLRKTLVKKSLDTLDKKAAEREVAKKKFVEGGQKLHGISKSDMEELWEQMRFFSLYGFNKSVHFDERIDTYDQRGRFISSKPIRDFQGGEIIRSRDESTGKDIFVKVKANHPHGKLPLVKITLDDGSSIRCTMNHRFRTSDGRMIPLWQILRDGLGIVTRRETKKDVCCQVPS